MTCTSFSFLPDTWVKENSSENPFLIYQKLGNYKIFQINVSSLRSIQLRASLYSHYNLHNMLMKVQRKWQAFVPLRIAHNIKWFMTVSKRYCESFDVIYRFCYFCSIIRNCWYSNFNIKAGKCKYTETILIFFLVVVE